MYDYLLVGAGLFNSTFAHEATKAGKSCLVLEKRDHFGGQVYTYNLDGIEVHAYGAHIFRTSDRSIWDYIKQFSEFNHFVNSPIANYNGEIYNLPFNMNTFSRMWNISKPEEAKAIIEKQRLILNSEAQNLEEHAKSLVGSDVYEKLIKGYTEKQWGRPCSELPPSIMRRIPLRFIYDNNYYSDPYQGIPVIGYTGIIKKMLNGSEVLLNRDYNEDREYYNTLAKRIIYTGTIDSFFDYCYGPLEYRSLRFETESLDLDNYQGVAVVNYTDRETPFTRIIEHKHFEFGTQKKTVISKEFPLEWTLKDDPYYPINNDINNVKYMKYFEKTKDLKNVIFGGRLGEYKYYDMQDTIKSALQLVKNESF